MDSIKVALSLVATLALSACAGEQLPLTPSVAASLRGRQIATTSRSLTPFFVIEPGKSYNGSGLLQLAYWSDVGARILRENGIADATPNTRRQLRDDLQHRYDLKIARQPLYVSANDDVTQIAALDPEADLLLDVWIDAQSLQPFTLTHDPSKYQVRYTLNLRLIDAKIVHPVDGKKGAVIARGRCNFAPDETPSAPTYDEMLANGARRLKHELELAAQTCTQQLRSTILAVETPPFN